MKQSFIKSVAALSILLSLTTAVSATAGDKVNPSTEMKVVGTIKNQPVYELNINNSEHNAYLIVVTDEHGIVLYEEDVTGVNISRRFQINRTELGSTGVRFEVVARNRKAAAFTVKNNRVTAEDSTAGLGK